METNAPSCKEKNKAGIVKILMRESCDQHPRSHLYVCWLRVAQTSGSRLHCCREQKDLPFPSTIDPRNMEGVV